ncbi:sensor histidine kinase [Actinocrispum wychmicini]|uniref:histidine kinase n=1 Tax=Actinocrispum wychmicini TaxID=1213861 RepID=A0A4R2JUW1_9PSEU|nr:histidine kinase [Actinocrispum wychmicini]TCO60829.1 signal transduction histidine kinase [Actinocrispum wychmicini]
MLQRFKARLEATCLRLGVPYPWWLPLASAVLSIGFTLAALAQRGALLPPTPLALVLVPPAVYWLQWIITGWWMSPWLEAVIVTGFVAVLLTVPTGPVADFAPLVLVVGVAEVAATLRFRHAAVVAVLAAGVLVWSAARTGLIGTPVYLVSLVLGAQVGVALRWQIRALAAERENHAITREQAVSAERQRIAREVHDVVGHSLTITLLHLTGARHALQEDQDIAEAVEALTEAERVGRAAMADIRHSVGLLGSGPAETQPLPGIQDVPDLVERTQAAGIDVQYRQTGDLSIVDRTHGLGLYRIAQESLSNIAKHAPSATATVLLRADLDGTRLTVRNTLPAGCVTANVHGTGLNGMATRARQLGAVLNLGQQGEHWVVDLIMPFLGTDPTSVCPIRTVMS